jgi:hypothetical protein
MFNSDLQGISLDGLSNMGGTASITQANVGGYGTMAVDIAGMSDTTDVWGASVKVDMPITADNVAGYTNATMAQYNMLIPKSAVADPSALYDWAAIFTVMTQSSGWSFNQDSTCAGSNVTETIDGVDYYLVTMTVTLGPTALSTIQGTTYPGDSMVVCLPVVGIQATPVYYSNLVFFNPSEAAPVVTPPSGPVPAPAKSIAATLPWAASDSGVAGVSLTGWGPVAFTPVGNPDSTCDLSLEIDFANITADTVITLDYDTSASAPDQIALQNASFGGWTQVSGTVDASAGTVTFSGADIINALASDTADYPNGVGSIREIKVGLSSGAYATITGASIS